MSDIEQVPRIRYKLGQRDYALSLGMYSPLVPSSEPTFGMQCKVTPVLNVPS